MISFSSQVNSSYFSDLESIGNSSRPIIDSFTIFQLQKRWTEEQTSVLEGISIPRQHHLYPIFLQCSQSSRVIFICISIKSMWMKRKFKKCTTEERKLEAHWQTCQTFAHTSPLTYSSSFRLCTSSPLYLTVCFSNTASI